MKSEYLPEHDVSGCLARRAKNAENLTTFKREFIEELANRMKGKPSAPASIANEVEQMFGEMRESVYDFLEEKIGSDWADSYAYIAKAAMRTPDHD